MKRYSIICMALLLSLLSTGMSAREPLTFEQRVKALEAIEKVYYNHRIWPKENPGPKPAFEKMVSKETIENKVTDYLKKSAALEQFWFRPIEGKQLQAEMDRMAKGTKDPATLNELFKALNDDPYLIAECLARPVLADRLVRNWYANDERFHKETREKAEEALKHLTQENFCSYAEGQYSKTTYKLKIEGREEMGGLDPEDHSIGLSENEFAKIFHEIPEEGKISGVIEKDDCFVILHTVEKNEGVIRTEWLHFEKKAAREWLDRHELDNIAYQYTAAMNFWLPTGQIASCSGGWDNGILDNCPDSRYGHSAVWTGTEMIIWGGSPPTKAGGRYNPATDTWSATSIDVNCPETRINQSVVWTGSEMLIWGGNSDSFDVWYNNGSKYNPLTDTWTAVSTTGAPVARGAHSAGLAAGKMLVWGGFYMDTEEYHYLNSGGIYDLASNSWAEINSVDAPSPRAGSTCFWTGTLMIVWGGYQWNGSYAVYFNTGGRFNPVSNSWSGISVIGCPTERGASGVWTGHEMIIWGGENNGNYFNDGKIYDPEFDQWTNMSVTDAPLERSNNSALWTGSKMIVWGGSGYFGFCTNSGGIYDPETDSWSATSTGTSCPTGRFGHSDVWTGSEMIVWGGWDEDVQGVCNTGGRYNPLSDSWVPTAPGSGCPSGREWHTTVWTGSEMLVWGGLGLSQALDSGGAFNPAMDSWIPIPTGVNHPSARFYHSAVWSGSEMAVWGGTIDTLESTNTGARFNPTSDTWLPISTGTNCPVARDGHTAVWSGSHMIIWGGTDNGYSYNSGSKYNPLTDSWTAISAANAPAARAGHTSVWTGTKMIVWGGSDNGFSLNSGGNYDDQSNSWTATSSGSNCPSPRTYHTAVWTGTEMIAWGGYDGNSLASGGRYNPVLNTWSQTSTVNAPSARDFHTAVWTGSKMLVWGGSDNGFSLNSGGNYDDQSNSWTAMSEGGGCPNPRREHTAVWTGERMIVWGGYSDGNKFNNGGQYIFPHAPSNWSNNSAADADGCSASGVGIHWSAPGTWGDNGSGERSYDVLRDGIIIASGIVEGQSSFTDSTGSVDTTYLYQVRANNGCGLSTTSAGEAAADHSGGVYCSINILYQSHGSFSEITGDGDSYFEKGELWSVPVTVTNSSNSPASNVIAALSGNGITVCNATGSFGTIAAGGTGTFTYNFVIDDDFTPCGGNINFNLGSKACTELTPAGADEMNLFSVQVGQIAAGVPTDLVIQPSNADSYVNQASAGTNYGTAPTMLIQARNAQARRSLVQFDISAIPSGSTINSATLELYATAVTGALTLNVHRITGTWTETGVTWTNQPSFTSTADASITGGTSTGWKIWDVASVVQQWVGGTENYGFIVKAETEIGLSTVTNIFASKENATTGNRPILRINYTPPATLNCDYVGSGECDAVLAECAPGDTYENGQMWSGASQSWPALTGAAGYKLYRGIQSGLQNLLTADNDSCLRYEDAATSIDLLSDDPSGETGRLYWYIVTGTNGSGEGPAGNGRIVNSSGNCQ